MNAATMAMNSNAIADYINPVIQGTRDVFRMMLCCTPRRVGLQLKGQTCSQNSISGVIGITGRAVGTIVVCLPETMAIEVFRRLVGAECDSVTPEVFDAVGELTNMIAGAAKAQLPHLDLSLSLPNVVSGESYDVSYPSNVVPFCIQFESEIGPFVIETGFTTVS